MTSSSQASERRQLTVVFTDLVGSTELASVLDPEDWHEVLDAYQHKVADIVALHGGVIAQFQGDGAIAYFGYPEASEWAGQEALSAALEIVGAIESLGNQLPPAGKGAPRRILAEVRVPETYCELVVALRDAEVAHDGIIEAGDVLPATSPQVES